MEKVITVAQVIVPIFVAVLLGVIAKRRKQSLRRTRERRPDMYEKLDLSSKQDQKLLKEMEAEDAAGKTMG